MQNHDLYLWLIFILNSITGISLITIAIILTWLLATKRLESRWSLFIFAAGIGLFGLSHLVEVYSLWSPNAWITIGLKLVVSITTVVSAINFFGVLTKYVKWDAFVKRRWWNQYAREEISQKEFSRSSEVERLLTRALLLPVSFGVVLILLSFVEVYYIGGLQDKVRNSQEAIAKLQGIKDLVFEMHSRFHNYNRGKDELFEEAFVGSLTAFQVQFQTVESFMLEGTNQKKKLIELQLAYERWQNAISKFLLADRGRRSQLEADFVVARESELVRMFNDFINSLRESRTLLFAQSRVEVALMFYAIGIFTLVLGAVFTFFSRDAILQVSRTYGAALEAAKSTGQRLREAIASRDELFSITSHELRTPLTSLRLQLQLAQRKIETKKESALDPAQLINTYVLALKQTDCLAALVDDLLDTARIQTGNFSLCYEAFDLSVLLMDVIERFSSQLKRVGCQLECRVDKDLQGIFDRQRIEQVFNNLLSNVTKYAPGSTVIVSARRSTENCIEIAITDNGPGIEKSLHEKIFNRFERINPGKDVSGMGLGLFIVKKILVAHQGDIRVDSEPGKGSKFLVSLPYGHLTLR